MKYLESLKAFRERAITPDGQKLTARLRRTVDQFKAVFEDDPSIESGWGHVYFCSRCGTFLTFDPASPHVHRCSCCGHTETAPEYDASWVYLRRYDAVMSALAAAVLYRLDNRQPDLDYFRKVIGFYAENWYRFCEHGRNTWPSGNGKITPQALNEAIFLIKVLNGLELLKEDLDTVFLENVKNWFLIPCAYFLDVQKRKIHNIPCWLNAAVGAAALFCGNEDLRQRAFERRFGFVDQVRGGGVTDSYFWYEGSIHYNFFTLEAFMNTLLFAGLYGQTIPDDVMSTVANMLAAPCKYAFSNGRLPNPNDGWPNLNLKTYSFIYEMGAKIFADRPEGMQTAALAEAIRALDIPRVAVPLSYPTYADDVSLEWLLFGDARRIDKTTSEEVSGFLQHSCSFEASNFLTLKTSGVQLFHKYGHNTYSHAHPDKMTIEVDYRGTRISHDLSNCGYAAKLCPEFHRTSISHNTVLMNGNNHPTTEPGRLLSYTETSCETLAPEAYPGVSFRRSISVCEQGFTDAFTVENTGDEAVFDWVFHVDGRLEESVPCTAAELGYNENGYSYITNVRKAVFPGDDLILRWRFADGTCAVQTIQTAGKELFLGESPDNPPKPGSERITLILRSKEKEPVFRQSWTFE